MENHMDRYYMVIILLSTLLLHATTSCMLTEQQSAALDNIFKNYGLGEQLYSFNKTHFHTKTHTAKSLFIKLDNVKDKFLIKQIKECQKKLTWYYRLSRPLLGGVTGYSIGKLLAVCALYLYKHMSYTQQIKNYGFKIGITTLPIIMSVLGALYGSYVTLRHSLKNNTHRIQSTSTTTHTIFEFPECTEIINTHPSLDDGSASPLGKSCEEVNTPAA